MSASRIFEAAPDGRTERIADWMGERPPAATAGGVFLAGYVVISDVGERIGAGRNRDAKATIEQPVPHLCGRIFVVVTKHVHGGVLAERQVHR